MCKTGHEHAANEETHKPRIHTRHDNMKAHSQWKTQAACHTAQDITWMHTADKNTNCVQQHKTHMEEEPAPSELETRVSEPRHVTKTQDMSAGIRTPGHADERAHGSSHSRENRTWRECQGSVTKPWMTLDGSDKTFTGSSILFWHPHLHIYPVL